MKTLLRCLTRCTFVLALCLTTQIVSAQSSVPNILTYQGRVTVGGQPFSGTGQFKFALVSGGTNSSRTATAEAHYPGGVFLDLNIIDGGAGYTIPPTVTFVPINPGGSGGTATATVTGGAVTAITINNFGTYSGLVNLLMSPPPVSLGYATYWSHDNTSTGGGQPASAVALPVANGLFVVPLGDTNQANMAAFPANVATSDNLRLRIWFNDGTNGFAQLTPDQPLTAAPYALLAQRLDGSSPVVLNNASNTFSGNGAGLSAVNASTLGGLAATNFWKTGGNAGVPPASWKIGTLDNLIALPLKFVAGGQTALTLHPSSTGIPSLAGGDASNFPGADAPGVAIGGGRNNQAQSCSFATIGGGADHFVTASFATIAGGTNNQASGTSSVIGGGSGNLAESTYATVAGGLNNDANFGNYATVGGGGYNRVEGTGGTVAGGEHNSVLQPHGTVAGGLSNVVSNSRSTIGGGVLNSASGQYATVPGGAGNVAQGDYSFAAGKNATATHANSFIWSDGSDVFGTVRTNSFNVLAKGGYEFYTGSGIGVRLAPSGTSWAVISDRNAKKNFTPLDGKTVLAKLAAVPVEQWNYKWEDDTDVPNIGPMAQDFKAAFYPGRDDQSITTLEFDGVEMAAIKGLNQKVDELSDALKQREAENAALKARLEKLERMLSDKQGGAK